MDGMGHQLNFYLTDKDTEMVESAIRALEPVAVLHRRSTGPHPRVVDSLRYREDGRDWLFFELARPSDVASLALRHVEGPEYWTVDIRTAPVLEFSRPFYDGTIIRRGRIYFVSSYFDGNGVPILKDEAFVKWGKRVIRRVRGVLSRQGSFYIGPEARELLDASRLSLAP